MWLQLVNVLYVLVAIAMIGLILMQRGAGAQAGSGFGGGASATVFGARGASNFLSKSTKWLAIAFFGISLFMAWYATHSARPAAQQNLGVMSQLPTAAEAPVGELPKPSTVPSTPIQQAPAAPAGDAPAAPQQAAPASEQPPVTPPQGG